MKSRKMLLPLIMLAFLVSACDDKLPPVTGDRSDPPVTGEPDPGASSSLLGPLVSVPAGSFQRDGDPENITRVNAFRMSRYEINYTLYEKVFGLEGYLARDFSDGSGESPAAYVSWYTAVTFCNKLSLMEGLKPVYTVAGVDFRALHYLDIPWTEEQGGSWDYLGIDPTADGYRLPTEAEWMWASMGADSEDPGRINRTGYLKAFAGSTGTNSITDCAVFGYGGSENGRTPNERSNRCGSRSPNELGLYDLSGNVSEWCQDWYLNELPRGTIAEGYRGPADPLDATFRCRCIRGGSWYFNAVYATVASRESFQSPWYTGGTIGFRVVRN